MTASCTTREWGGGTFVPRASHWVGNGVEFEPNNLVLVSLVLFLIFFMGLFLLLLLIFSFSSVLSFSFVLLLFCPHRGGVLDEGCGGSNNHAVAIVGFNVDASPPYWVSPMQDNNRYSHIGANIQAR